MELPVDRVDDEAAEHIHLTMREIEHVHQREDQREAERDQRILRAEIEPVDDDLFHDPTPPNRRRSGCSPAPPANAHGVRSRQSTSATNRVANLPSLYSLTTSGTANCRFWPKDVVPT